MVGLTDIEWEKRAKTAGYSCAGVMCPACLRERPLSEANKAAFKDTMCQCGGIDSIDEIVRAHGVGNVVVRTTVHSTATMASKIERGDT